MAYIIDEVMVNNGQFIVAPADGLRSTAIDDNQDKKIKHSAYITGPVHVGDQAAHFSGPTATVMIARDANPLSPQSDKSVHHLIRLLRSSPWHRIRPAHPRDSSGQSPAPARPCLRHPEFWLR